MTGQEAIVQAVIERLTLGLQAPDFDPAVPPPLGLKAPHRSPQRPLDQDELPTFAVMVAQNNEDDNEGEEGGPDGPWRRVLWIFVEARALAPLSDVEGTPDKHLDPLVEYAFTCLMSDQQLGGKCNRIEPERVMYEAFEGDRVYLAAAMLFRVYYLGDPI